MKLVTDEAEYFCSIDGVSISFGQNVCNLTFCFSFLCLIHSIVLRHIRNKSILTRHIKNNVLIVKSMKFYERQYPLVHFKTNYVIITPETANIKINKNCLKNVKLYKVINNNQ